MLNNLNHNLRITYSLHMLRSNIRKNYSTMSLMKDRLPSSNFLQKRRTNVLTLTKVTNFSMFHSIIINFFLWKNNRLAFCRIDFYSIRYNPFVNFIRHPEVCPRPLQLLSHGRQYNLIILSGSLFPPWYYFCMLRI